MCSGSLGAVDLACPRGTSAASEGWCRQWGVLWLWSSPGGADLQLLQSHLICNCWTKLVRCTSGISRRVKCRSVWKAPAEGVNGFMYVRGAGSPRCLCAEPTLGVSLHQPGISGYLCSPAITCTRAGSGTQLLPAESWTLLSWEVASTTLVASELWRCCIYPREGNADPDSELDLWILLLSQELCLSLHSW